MDTPLMSVAAPVRENRRPYPESVATARRLIHLGNHGWPSWRRRISLFLVMLLIGTAEAKPAANAQADTRAALHLHGLTYQPTELRFAGMTPVTASFTSPAGKKL